jgi:hypothetical protein
MPLTVAMSMALHRRRLASGQVLDVGRGERVAPDSPVAAVHFLDDTPGHRPHALALDADHDYLLSSNDFVYFVGRTMRTTLTGLVFGASVDAGRPLIARFAGDFCPLTPDVSDRAALGVCSSV